MEVMSSYYLKLRIKIQISDRERQKWIIFDLIIQLVCQPMITNRHPVQGYIRTREAQQPVESDEQKDAVELRCIEALQQNLQQILQTAQCEQSSHLHSIQQLALTCQQAEDLQAKYDQIVQRCEALQAENAQLKASCNRSAGMARQWQRKEALLNSKIAKLTHTITEKQAVIKYLEQKQEAKTRRSVKNSSQNSQSSLADSPTEIFIPSLHLENLSLPKTSKQPTFHDFMPETTRSNISECLRAESTVPSLAIKQDKYPSVTGYENYQSQPRRANGSTQRQWNDRKSITSNSSNLHLRNYSKEYNNYEWGKPSSHRQPDSHFVSTYSNTYFNRYSLATTRPTTFAK